MDKGWIKLYRKIQDNMLWYDSEPFDRRSAWIDLILMANVQNKDIMYRGQMIRIKRGQVYTSIRKLAARWHWSRDKVNRFIKTLIKAHMIEHDTRTQSATLLTIVKYGDFQNRADSNKATNKSTDKDSDKDTDESLLKKNKNEKRNKESAAPTSNESAAPEEKKERVEVIPGYTQEELDETFIDGFIPMTEEEWNALPEE